MTDNPDYGTIIFGLLAKAEAGNPAPLAAYLAADPARAASGDRDSVLLVRHQFGTSLDGRWHAYSAQPDRNPWPGTPTRSALVLIRSDAGGGRSWHELTLPEGARIDSIGADGGTFRIMSNGGTLAVTGDDLFRVIADCSFGQPGLSEAEIARGFDKLAGRAPMDVLGPPEPGAPLGRALPLVLNDPKLGRFSFRPQRPARYTQTHEDGPTYSLLTGPAGEFLPALARAREVLPAMDMHLASGARLVQAAEPDFGRHRALRLVSAEFRSDGTAVLSIDDGTENPLAADLELAADGRLTLANIDRS
jgi:hypothetical protein